MFAVWSQAVQFLDNLNWRKPFKAGTFLLYLTKFALIISKILQYKLS